MGSTLSTQQHIVAASVYQGFFPHFLEISFQEGILQWKGILGGQGTCSYAFDISVLVLCDIWASLKQQWNP